MKKKYIVSCTKDKGRLNMNWAAICGGDHTEIYQIKKGKGIDQKRVFFTPLFVNY